MRNLFILMVMILLLPSCVTSQAQKLNPAVYYKQDICFTYKVKKTAKEIKIERDRNWNWDTEDGFNHYIDKHKSVKFCGVGVLPFKDSYKLKIEGYGKLHYFALTTCHEEDTTENPDRGIFKKDGRIEIEYTPTLERGRACPLYVSAYNKNQRHAWGILEFEHPRYKLKAKLMCNGYVRHPTGVSICQSRKGLIQRIEFNEEVKAIRPTRGAAEKREDCPELTSKDNKIFEFKLPSRECRYGFIGKESGQVHKLLTVGYEDIIVRE